jgi:hypothetical protein
MTIDHSGSGRTQVKSDTIFVGGNALAAVGNRRLRQSTTGPFLKRATKRAGLQSVLPIRRIQSAEAGFGEPPTNSSSPVCPDSGSSWCQQYIYDPFANRSIWGQSNLGISPLAPTSFDTTTNRNSGTGWGYDNAGNITADPGSTSYHYDAENRQTSAGTSTYVYDGNGQRVFRTVNGTQAVYAYDAFGMLVAEYASSTSPSGTVYLTADHLGSTRLITSAANTLVSGVPPGPAGTAIECRDYLQPGTLIHRFKNTQDCSEARASSPGWRKLSATKPITEFLLSKIPLRGQRSSCL